MFTDIFTWRTLTEAFIQTLWHMVQKPWMSSNMTFPNPHCHRGGLCDLCWRVSFQSLLYSKNVKWRGITMWPKGFPMPFRPIYVPIFYSKHWCSYRITAWLVSLLVLEETGCLRSKVISVPVSTVRILFNWPVTSGLIPIWVSWRWAAFRNLSDLESSRVDLN